ncbi:MAG: flavodoxin family protein, partial [Solobacterium sp.]|nr:flavodoxin family protein [Solobacterium sp.]
EFDAMIVGGPVYWGGICAQLTAFLDRLFYSASGNWCGKPGTAIVSCRRAGNTAAYQRLLMYFGINNMPIVPSQYWNEIHGNTREQAMQDLEGRQIMRTLGENLVYMLKCRKAAEDAGVPVPEYEPRIHTNFIR